MAMSKRDVELEEYLKDMEIQSALRQLQHRNRRHRHTAMRDRRYAPKHSYRTGGIEQARTSNKG